MMGKILEARTAPRQTHQDKNNWHCHNCHHWTHAKDITHSLNEQMIDDMHEIIVPRYVEGLKSNYHIGVSIKWSAVIQSIGKKQASEKVSFKDNTFLGKTFLPFFLLTLPFLS